MDEWVRLGSVAVDGGLVALSAVPVRGDLNEATSGLDVELAVDLRLTHQLAAVVVRAGAGDGVYPVQGKLTYDPDGTARLAQVRIVFVDEPAQT